MTISPRVPLCILAVLCGLILCPALVSADAPHRITVVSDDNYPPYVFRDADGRLQGILVDMWAAWEKTTGISVELRGMAWNKALEAMGRGEADVIDTIFFNTERARHYAFSKAYADLEVPLFFHKSLSGITDTHSLRGFTVGVKNGDAVVDVLKSNGITDLREYPNYEDIIAAAGRGELRVFSIDAPPAYYYLNKAGLTSDFRSAFILYTGQFHRAVRLDNTALLAVVEQGFRDIPEQEVENITKRWMGTPLLALTQHPLVRTVAVIVTGALALFIVFAVVLRRQVRLKTRALNAAVAKLRDSEIKYRNVIEHAAEVICVVQDERIKFVTPSVFGLCGFRPEDILETTGQQIVLPDDHAEVIQSHKACLNNDANRARKAFRIRHKSGDVRHVSLSSTPIDWEGRPATLNFLLDITERVQAEDALRESESKLRSLFNSMTDVIIVFDAEGRYVDIAPTRTDRLYMPPGELLGKTLFELFPVEKAEFFMNIIRKALETGETVSTDYALPVEGQSYWFSGNASRLSDNTVLWVARDITERKAAENVLRDNEERFRFILNDISQIAVQGYDAERSVIFWNEASEQLYGYTESEALGRKLEDLIIPADMRDGVIAGVRSWVAGGDKIPPGELVLRHKDGHDVPVYSSHVLYVAPAGRKEMFCVDLDLAPIQRMQQELVEARDRAEAANLAKSAFLANMSHEIRTPLNGVLGMLELLSTTTLGREQREYVDNAVVASGRLTRLLSDILDLSRIESNKLVIEGSRFSLRDVFRSVHELFTLEARGKRLTLDIAVEADIPDIFVGDEHRLRQVLFNLVGNSLKFTRTGVVTVRACGIASFQLPYRILFSVEDTGIGIAADDLRMIFEPFTQVSGSYVRGHQGAGLGLAIVKRLVSLMGGDLFIDSAENTGTLVCFSLPLAPGTLIEDLPQGRTHHTALQGMNILLAEDDPINQLAIRRMLEKTGATVTLAETGARALDLASGTRFDLLLMDIQMPEMDGVTATRRIRALPAHTTTPIVALTAYAMQQERDDFLRAGMDACLSKPVCLNDILTVLDELNMHGRNN